MGRYKTIHQHVDNGFWLPGLSLPAKKTTIVDTRTGARAEGFDRSSFSESDRKAWENLRKLQSSG
jgi:hypothetical protein